MSNGPSGGGFMTTELGLRIASAIVMLIIVLMVSWIGGFPFIALSVALSGLLFFEWQAMVRKTPFDGTEALLTAGFVGLMIGSLFGFLAISLIVFVVLGLVLELASHGDEKSDVRWIGLGALYCAIPAICFPIIREIGGFATLTFLFFVVWATDVVAYFAGRQFGGAKLMPSVSPKKTWSGAIGGFVGALIIAIAYYVGGVPNSLVYLLIIAGFLSIVSQIGDLFESGVKRHFGTKDSGTLIPGHGGFLDRLDGLVAAAVPVALILWLSLR